MEYVPGIAAEMWDKPQRLQQLQKQADKIKHRYQTVYQPGKVPQVSEYVSRTQNMVRFPPLVKLVIIFSIGYLVFLG